MTTPAESPRPPLPLSMSDEEYRRVVGRIYAGDAHPEHRLLLEILERLAMMDDQLEALTTMAHDGDTAIGLLRSIDEKLGRLLARRPGE